MKLKRKWFILLIKEVKKTVPKKKQNKTLRENNPGRLEQDDIVSIRIPAETLSGIKTITASLNVPSVPASLETMYIILPGDPQPEEERFLADIVAEKTGIDKLSFKKITKAGLNLVSNISKEKFQYETNDEGQVTEYTYDSRLLAFTIPTKNAADEK